MNAISNKDAALSAFVTFWELVAARLQSPEARYQPSEHESIRVAHINPRFRFLSVIEEIESSSEFCNVITSVAKEYKEYFSEEGIRTRLQNFLRRSGLYVFVQNGEEFDIMARFEAFYTQLLKKEVAHTKLTLLNAVSFPLKSIEFDGFEICRFTKSELDDIFETEMCSLFYPYAVVDTELLSRFWYLKETYSEMRNMAQKRYVAPDMILAPERDRASGRLLPQSVPISVPRNFPARYLQLLVLYDWKAWWVDHEEQERSRGDSLGFFGFSAPYVFDWNDDVFEFPRFHAQHYPQLWLDEDNQPDVAFELETMQLAEFTDVVRKAERFMQTVELPRFGWEFLDVALGYLSKAFFTTDTFEALLWNVCALEALLGDIPKPNSNSPVRSTIKRRLGNILGRRKTDEKQHIRNVFDQIYNHRNVLVHAANYDGVMESLHVNEARNFARRSVVWFIDQLNKEYSKGRLAKLADEQFPRREDLLRSIDQLD
jgi:hypothetical protein